MVIISDEHDYDDDNNNTQVDLNDLELFFGDFSNKDYDTYFSSNNIQNFSVQFLCDTYNATKSWVEEGRKQTFLGLDPVDDDDPITFHNQQDHHDESAEIKSSPHLANANGISESDPWDTELSNGVSNIGICENKCDVEAYIPEVIKELPKNSIKVETKDKNEKEHVTKTSVENKNGNENVKSWASLFKTSDVTVENIPNGVQNISVVKVEVPLVNNEVTNNEIREEDNLSMILMEHDERASKLAEFISDWYPDYSRQHLQLHGLINRANWCYINATLQALLAIPAIYHFYKNLGEFLNEKLKKTSTPLTDSMIAFFYRFEPIEMHTVSKKDSEDLHHGVAFEPKCVYDVLSVMKTSLSEKGRQEDAEEFLSFLLNGIHDELVALSKLVQPKVVKQLEITNENGDIHNECNDSEEEAWEQVGPKNKVRTIRKAVIEESLIKHMFGGVICSSVLQTGVKESTTFQPFFTLQLDIQSDNIQTLNDAVECYFMKEKLQGFTCAKTKTEVEASRRISLEELPLMFIFHLKYFVFDRKGGSQKIHKEIEIPVDLEIPRDILSNGKNLIMANTRRYKLHAIVYHHGKHSAGGHYTASVHHGNPFGWIHFDDNHVKTVTMTEMVKHQQGSVPYLLFYERIQHR